MMMIKTSAFHRIFLVLVALDFLVDRAAAFITSSSLPSTSPNYPSVIFSSPSSEEDIVVSKDPDQSLSDDEKLEKRKKEKPLSLQTQSRSPSSPSQPSASDIMRALGTSPRRIFLSLTSATGIALAGNFLGVTSNLLTKVPEEVVEASQLDTYFPRGDFKRCRSRGYTFVIPKEWVADTFVELAKAQRRIQPLDYSMSSSKMNSMMLPDAAYGPAGRLNTKGVSESGDTNVSVIVNSGLNSFSLERALGSPQRAAETLLSKSIAPEGSGRVATLLTSFADKKRNAYQFEYIVNRGERGPPLRNIAVIAASVKGDSFYTLTVVAPASEWERHVVSTKLRKVASSFHLTNL